MNALSKLSRHAAVPIGVFALLTSPLLVRGQNKSHMDAPRSQQSPMQGMMQDVRQLRGLHGADLERTYLTQMLDHHQSAIDMSQMALPKTQNPGLRREEHRIISDQRREITQMQTYLARYYGIHRSAKPDPRMQETMQKLASLSGPQFDRAFVKEMSGHHEVAIQMSQPVIARSPHPSVRRLAAKIADGNRASQRRMHHVVGEGA
jgi:uncharacterized protein (DUF305 family)